MQFLKDVSENGSTNNEDPCIIAIAKINYLKFLKNVHEDCTIFLCKKHNLCNNCIILIISQGFNHCLLCQNSNFDNYFNKNKNKNKIKNIIIILLFIFLVIFLLYMSTTFRSNLIENV